MQKLNLRQKNALRQYYINDYSDLIWFLCYGVGGICYMKYIPLVFGYSNREMQNILNDLELIGFIESIFLDGYKLVKVKNATYDYMELTEEERKSGKRKRRNSKANIQGVNRSAMICDYYLYHIKKGNSIQDIINKVKTKSNFYFLDKNASTKMLLYMKRITKNESIIDEMDKHIQVIERRFERHSIGHKNLEKADSRVNINNSPKSLYDTLFEEGVITLAEKNNWEDLYSLSLKNTYLWALQGTNINNVRTVHIKFVMTINPSIKIRTIYKNMKQAEVLVNNLFGVNSNTLITFDLISLNLSSANINSLYKLVKADRHGLLIHLNKCEIGKLDFITHIEADYTRKETLDDILYADTLI